MHLVFKNHLYYARFKEAGKEVEKSTGTSDPVAASKVGNGLEASASFAEMVCHFATYAEMGLSPRYAHDSFSHKAHMRFSEFKKRLADAGIEFKPMSKWRDKHNKVKNERATRFKYQGKMLTVPELAEVASVPISAGAIRYRLGTGWEIEEAISTAPMTRAESGRKGAEKKWN